MQQYVSFTCFFRLLLSNAPSLPLRLWKECCSITGRSLHYTSKDSPLDLFHGSPYLLASGTTLKSSTADGRHGNLYRPFYYRNPCVPWTLVQLKRHLIVVQELQPSPCSMRRIHGSTMALVRSTHARCGQWTDSS